MGASINKTTYTIEAYIYDIQYDIDHDPLGDHSNVYTKIKIYTDPKIGEPYDGKLLCNNPMFDKLCGQLQKGQCYKIKYTESARNYLCKGPVKIIDVASCDMHSARITVLMVANAGTINKIFANYNELIVAERSSCDECAPMRYLLPKNKDIYPGVYHITYSRIGPAMFHQVFSYIEAFDAQFEKI